MFIGEIISHYRTCNHISQRRFANKCDLSASYINTLEKIYNPKTKKPYSITTDVALRLAKAMQMPIEELLNLIGDSENITLSSGLKDKINHTILRLEEEKLKEVSIVPIYETIEDSSDWEEKNIIYHVPLIPDFYHLSNQDTFFYWKIDTNDMNQIFKKDSYVLIRKQNSATDGNIILCFVDHVLFLRKYKKITNQIILLESASDDLTCESISVDQKKVNFKILGKAFGYLGSL